METAASFSLPWTFFLWYKENIRSSRSFWNWIEAFSGKWPQNRCLKSATSWNIINPTKFPIFLWSLVIWLIFLKALLICWLKIYRLISFWDLYGIMFHLLSIQVKTIECSLLHWLSQERILVLMPESHFLNSIRKSIWSNLLI